MPRPATRLSSLLVAPMAPVLLGGYDATMRRSNGAGAFRSVAEVHPYKMPKGTQGTPAVLVASSLEILFNFGEKRKNEKTLYKSRDTKRTKRKITVYLFLRGLQASTCFDRFFHMMVATMMTNRSLVFFEKISSRCRKPCFFNHPLTVVVISKFPSAKNSSRRLGDTVTILKGQMLF